MANENSVITLARREALCKAASRGSAANPVNPINRIVFGDGGTARYSVTIPASDLPGAAISEVGLIDSEGTLCAIKTMYAKRKDPGVTFTFTFDDVF